LRSVLLIVQILRVFLPPIQMFEVVTNEVPTFLMDILVRIIRMISM